MPQLSWPRRLGDEWWMNMRSTDYLVCEHIGVLAQRDLSRAQMHALLEMSQPCWQGA